MDASSVFKNDIAELYGKDFYYSRRFAKGDFNVIKPHSHAHYEIYYLTAGARRYFINNKIYTVTAGDVVIIEPNVIHYTAAAGADTHERVLLNFTESYIAEHAKPMLAHLCKTGCVSLQEKGIKKADGIFARIAEEYCTRDKYSAFLESGYLSELFAVLIRAGEEQAYAPADTEDAVSRLLEYVGENLSHAISLEEAASVAGFSKSHFSKLFREQTGFTFNSYLQIQRLQKARRLLEKTQDSITDIAYECGFMSSGYFATVFKNYFDISPLDYRHIKNK